MRGRCKSSLHFGDIEVLGEVESETIEQDQLVLAGPGDAAAADVDPGRCGKHDVHLTDLTELVKYTPRLVT